MKQLYKIMALFLLLAVADGHVGYAQSDSTYHPGEIRTGDTVVCFGDTVHQLVIRSLSAPSDDSISSPSFEYRWLRNQDTLSSNTANYTVSGLRVDTDYTFVRQSRLVDSAVWHTDSGQYRISVRELPTVSITGVSVICQGDSTRLIASGAQSYLWSTGDSITTITVYSTDIYKVTGQDSLGCASTDTMAVTVNQPVNSAISNTVCGSFTWHGTTYTTSGDYTYSHEDANGCTQVDTLHLTMNYATTGIDEQVACDSFIWIDGNTYTESTNTATYTLTNAAGCDSVVTLNLTINPTYEVTDEKTICFDSLPYTWNDSVFTEAGMKITTLETVNGCDSVVAMILVVNPLPIAQIIRETDTICDGETVTLTALGGLYFEWNTQDSTQHISVGAGHYSVFVTDENGCVSQNPAEVTVTERQPFTAGSILSGNTIRCAGTTTSVTISQESAASGGDNKISYRWKCNNEVIPDSTNNTLNVYVNNLNPGTYLYTREAKDSTCNTGWTVSEGQYTIIIEALPDVHILASADTICHDDGATLVATGGASYRWSTSDTTQQITLAGDTTTIYTVTATSIHNCSASDSLTITVLPTYNVKDTMTICESQLPYVWNGATFTAAGTKDAILPTVNGCDRVVTMTLMVNPIYNVTDTKTICASQLPYEWNGVTFATAGTKTTTLNTVNGCDSMVTMILTVNPTYNVTDTKTICASQLPHEWNGVTFAVAGTKNVTLQSVNDCDSVVSMTLMVNPTYNTPISESICQGQSYNFYGQILTTSGVYTHTLPTSKGCDSIITLTLTVNPLPTVTIVGESSFCQGDHVTLTATGASSYKWSDNSTATSIIVSSAGAYSVTGTVNGCSVTATKTVTVNPTYNTPISESICQGQSYDFYGQILTASDVYTHTLYTSKGCDSTITLTLTVHPLPNVTISGNDRFCFGENVTLTASDAAAYLWSNGDTTKTSIVNAAGTYKLTCTNQYGCTASAIKSVSVDTLPTITISGNSSFCHGTNTTLTASGANTYIWNTGAGTNSIVVSDGGIYSVTGTNDNGCRGTASVMTFVKPLPVPQIIGPSEICQGDTATLTVYGGNTYVWSNNSTQNSINVTQGGAYTVTATSTEQCSATTSFTLTVNPLPTITIIGDISFCQDTNTTLTASGASTYFWSNGASGSTITVNTAGTYTVTGTDNNGCTASTDKVVTVDTLPVITITGVTSFCYGSSTGLTASGAETYIWSTGSGTNSITVTDGGMYSVTGTNGNGCRGTASVMTFVKPLPVPLIIGPSEICEGDTATLTAYGGNTYLWNNGSTQNSINVTQSNTYTVTATSSEECSAIDTFTLTVHSLPTVTITGESSFCQGSSSTLTASGANTYVWSNGATGSTNIVNTAGTYTVTGTDANGCMAFAHKTVTVDTLPVVTINGTTSFCYGSSTTLTASGANTYVWSTEEATNNITVTNGGIFSVTGTNANNCQGMATAETFVLPLPTPVISGDTVICSYETTTLIAGGGVEYEWITGDTSNQIQVTAGTYSVTVTDIYGCHATTSQTVTVLPSSLQQLSIVAKTHADGTPYMLIYPQAGLLYQWYRDGDAISGATGQYYVPEDDLQTSTACYRVLVRPDILHCGIMTDCWVKTDASAAKVCILPNPNDGRFRLLLPADAVSVRIFNANGQLVLARETAGEIELTISADLANGLYMVQVQRENGEINTEKLVINR